MPTYLTLFRYTPQGIAHIKDSPARVEAAKQTFHALGAEVKAFYLVMGQYDTVFISEAPDDETMAKATLAVAAQGNVTTETLRAFTEEEFRTIVAAVP